MLDDNGLISNFESIESEKGNAAKCALSVREKHDIALSARGIYTVHLEVAEIYSILLSAKGEIEKAVLL